MCLRIKSIPSFVLLLTVAASTYLLGQNTGTNDRTFVQSTAHELRDDVDVASRNLLYGAGGEERQPGKTFTFLEEDTAGSNPKFDVRDENGVKWKVKLGDEAQPEVAASRLVWAVGYHTDYDYLVPEMRVEGLAGHLHRGASLVGPDGTVHNARLKRREGKKVGSWSWRQAWFGHTREFNGLRVMMALVDNWDLKDENNAIFEKNGARFYEVTDLGASFGTTGEHVSKDESKGNYDSFVHAKFITHVSDKTVDFGTPAMPSLPFVFTGHDYERRARMRWIGHDIPLEDARWMGSLLGQLTPDQIRDAFRAAGYSPSEVEGFAQIVRERMGELKGL